MFHEPPEQFLYSAYRVETQHASPDGTVKEGSATAFVLEVAPRVPWIVTNRHVVDLDYRQATPKYKDFVLSELNISGRRSDDSTYTLRLHPEADIYVHTDSENDVILIQGRMWLDNPEDKFHWHFGLEYLAWPICSTIRFELSMLSATLVSPISTTSWAVGRSSGVDA